MTPKRVLIGTPVYGGAHPHYVTSLDTTVHVFRQQDIQALPLLRSGSLLTLLRNGIAAEFLASRADVLLWIDADEGWYADDALALVRATEFLPIVAGVYREKPLLLSDLPWAKIAEAAKAGVDPSELQFIGQKLTFDFRPEDIDAEKGYVGPIGMRGLNRFVRVAHAGTGFLAVTRDALMKMAPLVERTTGGMRIFFDTGVVDEKFNGEDWLFCNIATKAGLEIWMHAGTRITHYGQTGYVGNLSSRETLDDYARQQAARR